MWTIQLLDEIAGQKIPRNLPKATPTAAIVPVSEFAAQTKAAWARLTRKVYEADPLECPKYKGPMRVIALIDDPIVVREISTHLGR